MQRQNAENGKNFYISLYDKIHIFPDTPKIAKTAKKTQHFYF